nr:hypothetical protein TDPV-055 [Oriental turtle dovepox virus]
MKRNKIIIMIDLIHESIFLYNSSKSFYYNIFFRSSF